MKINFIITILLSSIVFTSCNEEDFLISPSTDELFHLKNEEYLIPIRVRGNTTSGKIILFVQGGPGSNTLDFAEIDYPGWKKTLEKEYAIAYYDQRGTGNRQGNFKLEQISVKTYVDDLHQIASFLSTAYNAEIIMMGHSFGGQLTYRYMLAHPTDGIPNKYISVNGSGTSDGDTLRWEFRREFLQNTAALEISKDKNVEEWEGVLSWLSTRPKIETVADKIQWNHYIDQLVYKYYSEKSLSFKNYFNVLFSSPYNPITAFLNDGSIDDIRWKLIMDMASFNLTDKLSGIDQDILLITGRYDDVCPPEEMNYVFNNITSSSKKIEIIENAGHESFNHQPEEFMNLIINYIK